MAYNTKEKPRVLRTQLTEETLRAFKSLAAQLGTTMAKLIEQLIIERLKKEGK